MESTRELRTTRQAGRNTDPGPAADGKPAIASIGGQDDDRRVDGSV
jgi:hypothetical protein